MASAEPVARRPGPAAGLLLALLPIGLAATPLTAPQPAEARGEVSRWGRGVFPVVGFAGYTSPFGMRAHPLYGGVRPHDGLDIAAPLGAPVRSWWGGRVVDVISDAGCGNGLVIRSGDYEHVYCHLGGSAAGGVYSSGGVVARVGQEVRTGQVIAHVGMSGSTTGPHLHWGLRYRGQWLDPVRVLRAMAASRRRSPNLQRMSRVDRRR
jgi:murein DD-endopeptidase MepM/ murein hydrolase activator NlpD